jgi:hypothetical protein
MDCLAQQLEDLPLCTSRVDGRMGWPHRASGGRFDTKGRAELPDNSSKESEHEETTCGRR